MNKKNKTFSSAENYQKKIHDSYFEMNFRNHFTGFLNSPSDFTGQHQPLFPLYRNVLEVQIIKGPNLQLYFEISVERCFSLVNNQPLYTFLKELMMSSNDVIIMSHGGRDVPCCKTRYEIEKTCHSTFVSKHVGWDLIYVILAFF